ncbi:unnamed protein product [Heligmosomoides polygyrus]|uniref:Protein kinase domain-containing protein n=1 Tax=Heligmosomoides polygyrus TaxID=6339 RepID=A0A183G0E9_HELPZ|nr:unnamed protein product [Heligmosomoides polygyrus]
MAVRFGPNRLRSGPDRTKFQPSTNAKVNYVYGGARGMAYLQTKEIIHRDIAARNCLLGEKQEVKISDFGLSFIGKTLREKKLKKVPLRWLSPETLKKGVYNTKTDVYSFSIMIWEIFSFGQLPFYKYDNKELRILIKEKRATLPTCLSEIPPEMNELRLRCMNPDPNVRPDFIELEAIIAEDNLADDVVVNMKDVAVPSKISLTQLLGYRGATKPLSYGGVANAYLQLSTVAFSFPLH